jgi:XTP/dITP diphosphohydrolase
MSGRGQTMRQVLIASKNPHKIAEMDAILRDFGVRLASVHETGDFPDTEETGSTLTENAILKAESVMRHTGIACVADDTGLEVDALGGAPGVRSARYAGDSATYNENTALLLKNLSGVPPEKRSARFRTVIALHNGRELKTFEGICEGRITIEPAGGGGFGYDPVFLPKGYRLTFAELDSGEKNRISHRGRALQKMAEFLKSQPEFLMPGRD